MLSDLPKLGIGGMIGLLIGIYAWNMSIQQLRGAQVSF